MTRDTLDAPTAVGLLRYDNSSFSNLHKNGRKIARFLFCRNLPRKKSEKGILTAKNALKSRTTKTFFVKSGLFAVLFQKKVV